MICKAASAGLVRDGELESVQAVAILLVCARLVRVGGYSAGDELSGQPMFS